MIEDNQTSFEFMSEGVDADTRSEQAQMADARDFEKLVGNKQSYDPGQFLENGAPRLGSQAMLDLMYARLSSDREQGGSVYNRGG